VPALLGTRIGRGMREDERTVGVKDIERRREFLRVPYGYLVHEIRMTELLPPEGGWDERLEKWPPFPTNLSPAPKPHKRGRPRR
jgi:hypothetical protein